MLMEEWFTQGSSVQVPAGTSILDAELQIPDGARGMIVVAHAGGRRKLFQGIQGTAECLGREGFATLVMNLLTEEESEIDGEAGGLRFETEMLAERLDRTADWLLELPDAAHLSLGYFGAGTGTAPVLEAAAYRPEAVSAVVVAGAGEEASERMLNLVKAPTLIIVAENDARGNDLSRQSFASLPGRKRMDIIQGTASLGENPFVLGKVARLAGLWFDQYLG